RNAPDRVVAPIVERVIRYVVLGDVAPYVLLSPVRQRVHLPEPVQLVPVDLGRARSLRVVLAPQPGDPGVDSRKRLSQRHDLALGAALGGGPGLAVGARGVEHVDLDPVALLRGALGLVSLLEQYAR